MLDHIVSDVRHEIRHGAWNRASFEEATGLGKNALYEVLADGWNPKLSTLKTILKVLEEV